MSRKIQVQFEVRESLIMKNTLEQMGVKFTESGDTLNFQFGHYPVSVNCETGMIEFDEVDQGKVDKLKQNYMVEFYRQQAIREGMQLKQEVNAKGEVVLHLSR
jgi:hypothetical protein